MCNINEFHIGQFGEFLLKSKLVSSGMEKFMVHWVSKFFDFRQRLHKMSWFDQLRLFLQDLNLSGLYQEWQIRQADLAVRLYFSNFMTASSCDNEPITSSNNIVASQSAALQAFQEALRLRNYSRRTELMYIGWT